MHIQSQSSCFDPERFSNRQPAAPQANRTATTQATALTSSTDFSGTLNVVTAEGDKVTLNLDIEADFRYANLSTQEPRAGQARGPAVKAAYAESSLSQSLGLTAEGNLNEQEIADLTKLFKSITNIFRKYLHGHDEQAGAKTAKLAERFDKLSSLADMDLSVDVTRSSALLATELTTKPEAQIYAPSDVVAEPSAEAPAPTGSSNLVDAPAAETVSTPAESQAPANAALKLMQDSVAASPKLKPFLPDLIKQAMSELKREPGVHATKPMMNQLHDQILQALQERKSVPAAAAITGVYAPKAPSAPEISVVA